MSHDMRQMLLAIGLSFGIMFCWQYFFPTPKVLQSKVQILEKSVSKESGLAKELSTSFRLSNLKEDNHVNKVEVVTPNLKGSISTLGLKFNDLILLNHKDKVGPDASPIVLFDALSHFVALSFCDNAKHEELPNATTLWKANGAKLTPITPVEFFWTNKKGVQFCVKVTVDKDYLFTFDARIQNDSGARITVFPCMQILKRYEASGEEQHSSHKGSIGCVEGQIREYSYKDLTKKGKYVSNTHALHWFGITDKYWLSALIANNPQNALIEVEKISMGGSDYMSNSVLYVGQEVESRSSWNLRFYLFAGAKHVSLLDKYRVLLNAPLFDRAIDFGWLYFLTKPLFHFLNFFYKLVKNFGLSIIMLTLFVRIVMFAFVIRSDVTMRKMKEIQPKMQRLKDLYKDDQERLRKEIMDLYRREKVSPIGCLPMLAQLPVFFAMYKVLDVALEMRHAPFFLWITDLSAKDPTNIFTIFGLLPWNPPSFLHIGIWPILMSVSMYFQQKLSPQPDDPLQAKVFAFMPLIMLFTLGNFAAGLVIYWTWSNCFSIGQQYLMNIWSQRRARTKQS